MAGGSVMDPTAGELKASHPARSPSGEYRAFPLLDNHRHQSVSFCKCVEKHAEGHWRVVTGKSEKCVRNQPFKCVQKWKKKSLK